MPDRITQFIVASDNANDYADSLINGLQQARLEEIDDLMNHPDNRDEELWDRLEVDSEAVVQEFEQTDDEDRDIQWILGLSGLAAAAQHQFLLDERETTILKPLAYRTQRMEPFRFTAKELRIAGRRGVQFIPETEFVQLQAKYLDELSFLKTMDSVELYEALRDAGALRPFDQHVSSSMQYVSRMTNYPENSSQWKAAVNDLIDKDSKRAIESMNRRSVERLYLDYQIDGDLNAKLAWIVEGGPGTCDYCKSRAGVILTYAQWLETGLPGEEVCIGGGRCRCHLSLVYDA